MLFFFIWSTFGFYCSHLEQRNPDKITSSGYFCPRVSCSGGDMCMWSFGLTLCVPHRAIVNLLQPALIQCGVGPVCVPIELLSTYFNLPQPSVVLVQCVFLQANTTLPQPYMTQSLLPVWGGGGREGSS